MSTFLTLFLLLVPNAYAQSPAAIDLTALGFAADEIKAVQDSVFISKIFSVKSYVEEANNGTLDASGAVRRESHGKGHACLRANFTVNENGFGTFKKGANYPAWIRISNGGPYQKDDTKQHISRGFGIKLLGVPGTNTKTHDFLFITSPRFFIQDIRHYPGFLKASGNGRLHLIAHMFLGLSPAERDVIFHRTKLTIANLLESPEYSAVPFLYGKTAVKYALASCKQSAPPVLPNPQQVLPTAGPNYLADAMNKTLKAAPPATGVCYNFFIQKPAAGDLVEDPTKEWKGKFEKVATIQIPFGQHMGGAMDYRMNNTECERMAFDPWNAPKENAPTGKVNISRKYVYAALSWFRRVEFPAIFQRWLVNHNDATIPDEYSDELAELDNPKKFNPVRKSVAEPTVDPGFKKIGIIRKN